MEPLRQTLNDRVNPPALSPVWESDKPDSLTLRDARAYRRLFSGVFMRRSPAAVARRGLFQEFLERSSLLKLEHDLAYGYDISVIPYPIRLDLLAWGLVVHPAGRLMEIKAREDGLLDLNYQGGYCRSKQDWRRLIGKIGADEGDAVRRFYNQVRILSEGRILPAATMGFGLWDALWMAFDLERACDMLTGDQEFIDTVMHYWGDFHLAAVNAMLDAGIKLILMRENPRGFSALAGMPDRLEASVGDHFRHLSKTVQSRGGCMLLDCDVDEIFETDCASRWGFHGIGPLLFRDEEDLYAARRCLTEELLLVGTIASQASSTRNTGSKRARGLILANRPSPLGSEICSQVGRNEDTGSSLVSDDLRLAS